MGLQVAFLRAINTGNRRVKMDQLRRPLEALGLDDVATFIASGNVVFRSDAKASHLEGEIEDALRDALRFEVPTFIRRASKLATIVNDLGFDTELEPFVEIGFLKKAPTALSRSALEALSKDTDDVFARGKEIYWIARRGIGGSRISGQAIEKTLGQQTTFRSVKMLRRLHAKLNT